MTTIGDRMIDISSLSMPVRNQLKQAKSAEDVQKIIAADGKIDPKEKAVLEEIEAELSQITEDGNQTLTFKDAKGAANSVSFGKGIQADTQRMASIQRLGGNTDKRADALGTAQDKADLRAFIESDQRLAGTGTDGSKTKYGTSGPGAAKVLMQDAFLLEKFGVLTESQKRDLSEIVGKLHTVKGFQGSDGVHKMEIGTDAISKEDITKLDTIVKDALRRLDGAELPKADTARLDALDQPSAGTPSEQFQTVVDNLDGINASCDAAIHDLELAYSEKGGGTGGVLNEKGRNFPRIEKANAQIQGEMDRLKTKVLPSLEAALPVLSQELQDAIVAKRPELKGKDKATILAALNDPAVSEDPAVKPKSDRMQAAMAAYSQLGQRLNQLADAKIQGVTRLKSLQTLVGDEQTRIAALRQMSGALAKGVVDLQAIADGKKPEGHHEAGKPETLKGYVDQAGAEEKQLQAALAAAKDDKAKIGIIRDNMIKKMEGLIDTYKGLKTSNATAIRLLEKELETLKALKLDNAAQAVEVVEEFRQNLIGKLNKEVGPLISKNEFNAMVDLDKNVTSYSAADLAASDKVNGDIRSIESQIQDLQAEKSQTIERTVNTLSKFADEKLAYGSHAQVNLSVSVGLGVGSEKFGAYAGVGVEGVARIGKEFGIAPVYRATLDLNFIAEAKARVPFLIDVEAKWSKTLLSGGVGFREMDQARNYIKAVNQQIQAEVDVGTLEQALKDAQGQPEAKQIETALANAKARLQKAETDLKAAEQYKFTLSNDRSSFTAKAELPAFHATGNMKVETNNVTYESPKEGKNTVEEKTKVFHADVNHYGVTVQIQNQTLLGPDGKPTAHSKDRYGFYLTIPPKDIGKLLGKGASLTASLGKETVSKLAEQIVASIGKIDPGAGITSAMVIALLEQKWAAATTQHAHDLNAVGHAAGHGADHAEDHIHKFHQEFLVGTEFIFEDNKFQYAAVEAAYEASFKDAGRISIPAGPVPLQSRYSVGFEAEVGVVLGKVKSNDYKAKQFMTFMRDLKPGMEKTATGAQMLVQYANEPALAKDPKVFEYAHGVLKDLRSKYPELQGLDDTETMKKCLENPDKYLKDTFFEEVLKYPKKGGHGEHVVG